MTNMLRLGTLGHKRFALIVAVVVLAASFQILDVNPAAPQSPELVVYRATSPVGLDPDSSAWGRAPDIDIPLTAQQAVWPFGGTVPMLEARALHHDGMLYIRLKWEDTSRDDEVDGLRSFVDAAAVEFPATAESSVPALCMGQADNGVNIWQWRAGGEARPSDIDDLAKNGYVDRYPSTDDLYFPARAAGNIVAQGQEVQDLVASGFGRLETAPDQEVQGAAVWDNQHWTVVFARELTNATEEKISLGEGTSTDVAFAVWDGQHDERNGLKSISAFVSLDVVGEDAPEKPRSDTALLLVLLGSLVAIVALGAAAATMSSVVKPGQR